MSEMMREAHTVAKPRPTGEKLRKALDMHLIRVGQQVEGGILPSPAPMQEETATTYRMPLQGAALSQVRFRVGKGL